MKRVLFLTNLAPSPKDNGGKIYVNSLIRCLHALDYQIDLLCFHDPKDSKVNFEDLSSICNPLIIEKKLITSLHPYSSAFGALKSLFSSYSFGLFKFKSMKMTKRIKSLLLKNDYEIVFWGCLAITPYLSLIKKIQPKAKHILCQQNCETLIMERRLDNTNGFLKRTFLKIEITKLKKKEREIIKGVDKTIVLSKTDLNEMEKVVKRQFSYDVVPIAVESLNLKNHILDSKPIEKLLFVGTLSWEPNNSGLIWFINNVLSKLPPTIELVVVGKGASNELKNKCNEFANLKLLGYVDSLDEVFNKTDLMIVPLFIGSGQRVKILEAFSRRMPVISTSIGAEGIEIKDKENIIVANNPEEFVKNIIELRGKQLNQIADFGRITFESFYSFEAVSLKIAKILSEII